MEITPAEQMKKAGTGDMIGLADTIKELRKFYSLHGPSDLPGRKNKSVSARYNF